VLRPRIAAFTVALLVPALATARPVAPHSADEAAVRAAFLGFFDALNALDAERMLSFMAPDVTAFVPSAKADRVDGREELAAIYRAFAQQARRTAPRLDYVPQDVRVEVAPPLALVTACVESSAPGLARRRTFVFRQVADRWLVFHFHASDVTRSIP
jgi:uncharacterized protein (TIGR02246 family)